MTTITFLDRATLPDEINVRKPKFEHTWQEYPQTSPQQMIDRCQDSEIIISNKVVLDKEVLSACPRIKHIAVAATGINNIDLDACQELGITVSNIRSYATTSVPEHVISMALILRRKLIRYRQQVIAGAWQDSPHFCLFDQPIEDLKGATFGIIGFGELGRATAILAHALGCKVIITSKSDKQCDFARQVDLEQLLTSSDIISCHCVLNDSTKNLIDKVEFNKMQNHAILINTARGGIVNEQALIDAITNNQIGGAGFDVLIEEPPKSDSPLLSIAGLDNVIITPHMAWGSQPALQTLADQLIDNVEAFQNNKPQNLV